MICAKARSQAAACGGVSKKALSNLLAWGMCSEATSFQHPAPEILRRLEGVAVQKAVTLRKYASHFWKHILKFNVQAGSNLKNGGLETILIKLVGQVEDCCMSPQPPVLKPAEDLLSTSLGKITNPSKNFLHLISIADGWDVHPVIILLACRFVLQMPKFGEKKAEHML